MRQGKETRRWGSLSSRPLYGQIDLIREGNRFYGPGWKVTEDPQTGTLTRHYGIVSGVAGSLLAEDVFPVGRSAHLGLWWLNNTIDALAVVDGNRFIVAGHDGLFSWQRGDDQAQLLDELTDIICLELLGDTLVAGSGFLHLYDRSQGYQHIVRIDNAPASGPVGISVLDYDQKVILVAYRGGGLYLVRLAEPNFPHELVSPGEFLDVCYVPEIFSGAAVANGRVLRYRLKGPEIPFAEPTINQPGFTHGTGDIEEVDVSVLLNLVEGDSLHARALSGERVLASEDSTQSFDFHFMAVVYDTVRVEAWVTGEGRPDSPVAKLAFVVPDRDGNLTPPNPEPELPEDFALHQNYPNPFNPGTTIAFDLPEPGQVTIKVYNMLGKEVRTLLNQYYQAGSYQIPFDGSDNSGIFLGSGVYFVRMQAGESFTDVIKTALIR